MTKKLDPVTPLEQGRLYTINQACELLAISRATFYRLQKEGVLNTVLINGRTPRVVKDDLDMLIANATRGIGSEKSKRKSCTNAKDKTKVKD